MRYRTHLFALTTLGLLAMAAPPPEAPFRLSGPLALLLPDGVAQGANSTGLPFQIRLSAGGRTIDGGPYLLNVPDAPQPFRLTLNGATFEAGTLSAQATITNGSGASLQGLRLDLFEATESFLSQDAEGKAAPQARAQKIAAPPLHFGDLGSNETSDPLPLVATGLSFGPETTQILVRGVVSGLRYEKTLAIPKACGAGQIEADGRGDIYLADTCGRRIAHIAPSGEISGIELPAETRGFARDPRSGRLAASYGNYREVRLIGAERQVLGTINDIQGLDTLPDFLRFDGRGKLWVEAGGAILRFGETARLEQRIRSIGGTDLYGILSFDIARDGTLWVVSQGALLRLPAGGAPGARLVEAGWRAGELTRPEAPRAAPDGTVWVVEGADPTRGAAERISVFDRDGRLLRIFGRGARAPLPSFPAAYHEAQVYRARDLAFGPKNRVYVSGQRPGLEGGCVQVFRRF